MNTSLFGLFLDLVVALGWGCVLFAVLVLGAKATSFLPLTESGRSRLAKSYPSLAVLVALIYILLSTSILFSSYPSLLPISLLVALVGVSALLWPFARDVLSGVFLRAEGSCQLDQLVQIGSVQGRIVRLGPRSLHLETQGGDVAVIPYSQISRQPIVRTSGAEQLAARTFELPLPQRLEPTTLPRALQAAALRCHWAALGRDPVVSIQKERLEVTVYAIDGAHLVEVEKAVRVEYDRVVAASPGAHPGHQPGANAPTS
jgi:hypothetical protein